MRRKISWNAMMMMHPVLPPLRKSTPTLFVRATRAVRNLKHAERLRNTWLSTQMPKLWIVSFAGRDSVNPVKWRCISELILALVLFLVRSVGKISQWKVRLGNTKELIWRINSLHVMFVTARSQGRSIWKNICAHTRALSHSDVRCVEKGSWGEQD